MFYFGEGVGSVEMRFCLDSPVKSESQDQLGFAPAAELLASCIRNTDTPFTYGVLGDWGTGKTSILHLLKAKLQEHAPPIIPIWFNPWKYENDQNMIYPLLHAIREEFDQHKKKTIHDSSFFKSLHRTVAASAFLATDGAMRMITKATLGEALKLEDAVKQLKMVEEHADELGQACSIWADQIAKLETSFEDLLGHYAAHLSAIDESINAEAVRFAILVDDLDRCLPSTTIKILESVKNCLSAERCIYILALNPHVVNLGIRVKYDGLDIDGRKYLEKILNYSFHVPVPQVGQVEKFAVSQLRNLVLNRDDRRKYKACFNAFGVAVRECNFANPRKIKRILNRYLMFLGEHESDMGQYSCANIARLLILAEYYPSVFSLYLTGSKGIAKIKEVGQTGFNLHKFEEEFGVAIADDYAEVSQMPSLFAMKPSKAEQHDLTNHAHAVFRLQFA
jgi:KAP-like P-loop domain-containing protein